MVIGVKRHTGCFLNCRSGAFVFCEVKAQASIFLLIYDSEHVSATWLDQYVLIEDSADVVFSSDLLVEEDLTLIIEHLEADEADIRTVFIAELRIVTTNDHLKWSRCLVEGVNVCSTSPPSLI
jgi:hypothetical protein